MIDKGKFTPTYISYYTFLLFFLFIASELSWNTMKISLFLPARRRSLICVAFPKCLISFCRGREHKTTIFFFFSWTLIQSFRIPLQRNLPTFNELSEIVWGSANSEWRFRSRRRRGCLSSLTSQLLEHYGWIGSLCCMHLLDSCVVLHKYLRSQRFNLRVLLETSSSMHLTLHMCHGCVFSGFVLDYHALDLLAALHVHRSNRNLISGFSETGGSTNYIAWKRWLFWNNFLLPWSNERTIAIFMSKTSRFTGKRGWRMEGRGSRIGDRLKKLENKINK